MYELHDRKGNPLTRQNALNVLYLRYVKQRHRQQPPISTLVSPGFTPAYDRSALVTKNRYTGACGPLGHLIDHWLPGGWADNGTHRLAPTADTMDAISRNLGFSFLVSLNNAYCDALEVARGMRGRDYKVPFVRGFGNALSEMAALFGLRDPATQPVETLLTRSAS